METVQCEFCHAATAWFEKNYIVWKHPKKEEDGKLLLQFEKNYIVWKRDKTTNACQGYDLFEKNYIVWKLIVVRNVMFSFLYPFILKVEEYVLHGI